TELGRIQAAGPEFERALIDFLNKKQKANGLWEDEVSYDSVNGLMKISVAYTSIGEPIPNADKAMASAIQMLKSTEAPAHVCSVYNPWEAVSNVLKAIKKVSGGEAVDELREEFRAEAEELIEITFDKLAVFKKGDGGFSYYVKYSAPNSQGSPVALGKSVESDVNATMICTNSIITAMFEVFGLSAAVRYTPADYAYALDIVEELGSIVKFDIPEAEVITFDDYDKGFGEEDGGVVTSPDTYSNTVLGDPETVSGGIYKWFQSTITKNPMPESEEDDLVLYSKSIVEVGAEKDMAKKPSSTRFDIVNAAITSLGDCYVYDADMYFVKGYGKLNNKGKATTDPLAQIFFMTESLPCSSVNLSVYTEGGVDYVKIGENYSGLDGKQANVAGKIPMGEWVNLRLEFYKNYVLDSSGKEQYKPMMKVFVNGKYQGECDANITGKNDEGVSEYYDRKIDQVSVSYCRNVPSEIYINNVLVERTRIKYVKETNPDAIVDAPIPDEPMREQYGFEDGLLNTSNVV
ncbi:MAG: hypothetical protein J6C39_02690, partial [Clostridia bacterium]|nr:hypothetical protein [Clostridia bacterium]